MSRGRQYTARQFIEAIPSTGGIVSAIARRVGCSWQTARRYIDNMPTVKAAYTDETESIKDMAESVLVVNIRLAQKQQSETGRPVDTGDAKWFLRFQAKDRGYVERTEASIDLTVKDMNDAIAAELAKLANAGQDTVLGPAEGTE